MAPDFVDRSHFDAAVEKAGGKLGRPPASLRLEHLHEGLCLQALHVGSYDDEGPILDKLHNGIMPRLGVTFAGAHHEIYLSDARRAEPEKLKTLLRQPIKRCS